MSGRFILVARTGILSEIFSLSEGRDESGRTVSRGPIDLKSRYNIAPGQEIAIVRTSAAARTSEHQPPTVPRRELALARWGLIPVWASASDVGVQITSCPIETADSAPSVRESFQARRCIIPADGFYEWRTLGNGNKAPVLVRLRPGTERAGMSTFGIAGLFDRWSSEDGTSAVESCAMLTVPANSVVKPMCERMPAIVRPQDFSAWLGGTNESSENDPRKLKDLCRAWPAEWTALTNVNPAVNSPRFDNPSCLIAID